MERMVSQHPDSPVQTKTQVNPFFFPGPIVRINPREISVHDPEFYNELYVTENKRRSSSYDLFCKGISFDGRLARQLFLSFS